MSLIEAKTFNEVVDFSKKIKKNIVITRGSKGSISIKGEQVIEQPAKKNLDIIDLTGAGDLFAAGYLHGIMNNMSIKESLLEGTNFASKIIQNIGARL
jgi:fructokinase